MTPSGMNLLVVFPFACLTIVVSGFLTGFCIACSVSLFRGVVSVLFFITDMACAYRSNGYELYNICTESLYYDILVLFFALSAAFVLAFRLNFLPIFQLHRYLLVNVVCR